MKITLICSDLNHPVNPYIHKWMQAQAETHQIQLVSKKAQATGGDFLFLVSCSEIVTAEDRAKYQACLVLHASDLPNGRGWSPHIWELSRGADHITLSLLEAEDKVDSGKIWKKLQIPVPGHALWDEINHLLFEAELELIDFALLNLERITPEIQQNLDRASYHPRRTPRDSELDINKTIADQFDLMRVCDPNRFPAYFEHLGHRYILKLEKSK